MLLGSGTQQRPVCTGTSREREQGGTRGTPVDYGAWRLVQVIRGRHKFVLSMYELPEVVATADTRRSLLRRARADPVTSLFAEK